MKRKLIAIEEKLLGLLIRRWNHRRPGTTLLKEV